MIQDESHDRQWFPKCQLAAIYQLKWRPSLSQKGPEIGYSATKNMMTEHGTMEDEYQEAESGPLQRRQKRHHNCRSESDRRWNSTAKSITRWCKSGTSFGNVLSSLVSQPLVRKRDSILYFIQRLTMSFLIRCRRLWADRLLTSSSRRSWDYQWCLWRSKEKALQKRFPRTSRVVRPSEDHCGAVHQRNLGAH